jgi:hypothetical protein
VTELIKDGELDRATDPEYASVSPMAVIGLVVSLVGLAVYAALLAWNFISVDTVWKYEVVTPVGVIPLAGLALSAAAGRRIRRSQGVLTGRRIARAGIVLGAAVAVTFAAVQGGAACHRHQVLATLEARALGVVDDLVADRYENVYRMIPEDFRRRQGNSLEQFREQFLPLFRGGGSLVTRELNSLQLALTAKGELIAPAEVRVTLTNRALDLSVWFHRAPGAQWELVGISGGETFESQMKHPAEAVPAVPAPYYRAEEHGHAH